MLPAITREQMILVDDITVNELGIRIELMMEHAGKALARHALDIARSVYGTSAISSRGVSVVVLCGSGNNGGGGLVAARRLKGWGFEVQVVLPKGVESLRSIPKEQLQRASRVGVPVTTSLPTELPEPSIVLDAYIGYGYQHRDHPLTFEVFEWLKDQELIVSLDAPSGLDVNDGTHHGKFTPHSTLTLAFVKKGLVLAHEENVGQLAVADIGVPSWIHEKRLGIDWTHPYSLDELYALHAAWTRTSILPLLETSTNLDTLVCPRSNGTAGGNSRRFFTIFGQCCGYLYYHGHG